MPEVNAEPAVSIVVNDATPFMEGTARLSIGKLNICARELGCPILVDTGGVGSLMLRLLQEFGANARALPKQPNHRAQVVAFYENEKRSTLDAMARAEDEKPRTVVFETSIPLSKQVSYLHERLGQVEKKLGFAQETASAMHSEHRKRFATLENAVAVNRGNVARSIGDLELEQRNNRTTVAALITRVSELERMFATRAVIDGKDRSVRAQAVGEAAEAYVHGSSCFKAGADVTEECPECTPVLQGTKECDECGHNSGGHYDECPTRDASEDDAEKAWKLERRAALAQSLNTFREPTREELNATSSAVAKERYAARHGMQYLQEYVPPTPPPEGVMTVDGFNPLRTDPSDPYQVAAEKSRRMPDVPHETSFISGQNPHLLSDE
jgi:hypothetical protein